MVLLCLRSLCVTSGEEGQLQCNTESDAENPGNSSRHEVVSFDCVATKTSKGLQYVFTEYFGCKEISLIVPQQFSHYYRGGFEQKMSKREAGLILGIRYS